MNVLAVHFIDDDQVYYVESLNNDTVEMQTDRNGIGVHSHVKQADKLSVTTTPHKDEALVFGKKADALAAQLTLRNGLANFLTTGEVEMPKVWRDVCGIIIQRSKFRAERS